MQAWPSASRPNSIPIRSRLSVAVSTQGPNCQRSRMPDTSTQTLSRTDSDSVATPSASASALLYLCLECDRPLAGGVRYALDAVDEVLIGRGASRSALCGTGATGRQLRIGIPDRRI